MITNIPNSFIQWTGSSVEGNVRDGNCIPGFCNDFRQPCLPIHSLSDIAFQVLVTGEDIDYAESLAVGFYLGTCPEGTVTESDFVKTFSSNSVILESGDIIVAFVPTDLEDLCDFAAIGDCITLVLFDAGSTEVLACSNCFEYVENICFTKLLKYRNDEDAFGFYYEQQMLPLYATFYNKIRIELTVHSPQFPKVKKVFRNSLGEYQKLAASLRKEYECLIGIQNEQFHQALNAALEHDYIALYNETLEVFEEHNADEDDNYKVEWQNQNGNYTHLGQATFKFKPTPYYHENSNC